VRATTRQSESEASECPQGLDKAQIRTAGVGRVSLGVERAHVGGAGNGVMGGK
jgi:hypothetical protein